ncbi:RidA family protein [Nitrosophilus alvini]|uniref:RidA family protein n=1 Tax=Nitrosophilus alvini TaxID=2714855 RepID=UPI00190B9499|nr:RidA family protein [Nitrosophilus alvini]
MEMISTDKAPQAIGPYSQAVRIGEFIYTSGQIALTPEGEMVQADIEKQTRQVLNNLSNVLEAAGTTLQKVVKTTIFLADMDDFAKVNEIYAEFFKEHKPARSTVAVKTLPKNALVEIEAIAIL